MWLKVLGPFVFARYGTLQMLTKISQCWHSLTPQGVPSSTAEQSPSGRLQMKSCSNVQSLWVLESIMSPCEKKLFLGGGGGENIGIESKVSISNTPAFTLPWCFCGKCQNRYCFSELICFLKHDHTQASSLHWKYATGNRPCRLHSVLGTNNLHPPNGDYLGLLLSTFSHLEITLSLGTYVLLFDPCLTLGKFCYT